MTYKTSKDMAQTSESAIVEMDAVNEQSQKKLSETWANIEFVLNTKNGPKTFISGLGVSLDNFEPKPEYSRKNSEWAKENMLVNRVIQMMKEKILSAPVDTKVDFDDIKITFKVTGFHSNVKREEIKNEYLEALEA